MSGARDCLGLARLHCGKALQKVQGKNRADWDQDENLRDAVCMQILALAENVKECLKRLPGLPDAHPHIPWSEIARCRDRMAHHYEGVDYDLVWEIVEADLPQLLRTLDELTATP